MKTILPSSRRHRAGFTLVELLVVIAIIGILAAMLVPVLSSATRSAKVKKAKIEISQIVTAIEGYDSAYGRFPVSSAVQGAAGTGDFTYGGSLLAAYTAQIGGSGNYATNNSEVIAILMDATNYPNGTAVTANIGHVKNPQQTKFLNATMSGYDPASTDQPLGGVDITGVYRDPWGNPYVITMDLNYDEQSRDAFYSRESVSQPGLGQTVGFNGLVNIADASGNGDHFQYHGKVMVWSAGPDKMVDPGPTPYQPSVGGNAITPPNKDNVVSWQ